MATTESHTLVLVSKANGYVIIPAATPLTRLNYFDGKFLRASDLKAEQDYLRQLVALSNQAGGAGVAHGFDLTQGAGDTIEIGAGLAIDPTGRVLLLPQGTSVNVQELIDKSRALNQIFGKSKVLRTGEFEECELSSAPPAVDNAAPNNLYVIVVSPADALCGEEDVYGKLCEEACATSTDRPYAVEGLMVRAVPLVLRTPLASPKVIALTQTHLRSRVASAYFEDERRRVANLISKAGLEQETWCLGADAAAGSGVPIGVVARAGSTTVFLDAWIARRERIDTPAKRYWQWRMMMRPWDVFLAQVLQFQCQLHDLFIKVSTPGGEVDPCSGARGVINEAAATIAELKEFYTATAQRFTRLNVNLDEAITFKGGLTRLSTLNEKLVKVREGLITLTNDRFLITGGIVELPSAGYLPVTPGAASTINQQVRRLLGEGVDLRFCVVRPDYVAHALEEAQHMERISLLQGLDEPQDKPEVDILVPNGEVLEQKLLSPGTGFEASVDVNQEILSPRTVGTNFSAQPLEQTVNFRGAARVETLATGGGAFYLSAEHQVKLFNQLLDVRDLDSVKPVATTGETPRAVDAATSPASLFRTLAASSATLGLAVNAPPRLGLWISLRCDTNVFSLSRGDITNFNARAIVASTSAKSPLLDVQLNGVFHVTQPARTAGTAKKLVGHIENAQLSFSGAAFTATGARSNVLVDLDAEVTLTAGSAIEVRLLSGGIEFVLSADWGKQPLEVTANIIERLSTLRETVRGSVTLADADLKENADVLSEKDSRHVQALAALEVIGKVLNDTDFADAKARLLFPPPPKPTDELLVRGTMDWVMFHRRRTKRCSQEICVAPAAPARQYFVYHLAVGSVQEVEPIKKKLLAGGIPETSFNKLPVVDFAGGLPTLVTDPQAWRQDWANIHPGNLIVYAGIANRDSAAADGDTLALTRLGRLIDSVAPVSTPHSQMDSELLGQVPAIPASSADGVIFLFTIEAADLTLTKTASPAEVAPGSNITYTLTVTNAGPEAAQNVVLTDPIPANTVFVSAQAPAGWAATLPNVNATGPVVFSKASVAANETATFEIVVRAIGGTALGGNVSPIVNRATVASATGDPNSENNTAVTSTPIAQPQSADLEISKSVSPAQYGSEGGNLTYQLVVRNIGPSAAQNVEVKDVLPEAADFIEALPPVGWTAIGPAADRTLLFRKSSMAVGETATIQIQVQVNSIVGAGIPSSVTNTATVQSATSDPAPNNNSDDATATRRSEQPNASLGITKTANASTVTAGNNVTYTIRLTSGVVPAQNVKIVDQLPAKETFVSAKALTDDWPMTTPAVGAIGGEVVFTTDEMSSSQTVIFEVVVKTHNEAGPITNTVGASASNAQNPSSATVTVNIVQPDNTRTALVVFSQPQTNGRVVLQGSQVTAVKFTNNVPDATTLNTALKGFPTGFSLGRFRRITFAGTLAPLANDAAVNKRVEAVANAVKANGGSVLGTNIEALVSGADRTGLANAGANLTGIDEVIFLDMG